MRTSPPALAPYLRSHTQAQILALLVLHPQRSATIAEITRATGAPGAVVHKEVSRLVDAGVLVDTRVGRARLVQANPDYRLLAPLTQIIAATYGPVPVLSALVADVPGIDEAYLFGSWAARHEGQPGDQPGDIDVLVIGTPDRASLNDIARTAEQTLATPVSITKVTPAAWANPDTDPFLRTVRSRPLVRLDLSTPVQVAS